MSPSEYDFSTIAALATPPGYGGIGVIRVSGSQTVALTRRVIADGDRVVFTPNKATLHQIVNPVDLAVIDQAIVTFFEKPHSFTGEDVIEISAHGSPIVISEMLRALFALGAKPAEPGEFSLRAFLNGRMDLAQAEAIRDIIHAQTRYQAQLAARQLRGELSMQLQPIKARLIELIVHFESAVEFVEDDLDPLDRLRFDVELAAMSDELKRLCSSYQIGRVIRSGFKLALIGRPNVGKSSLFNSLLGRDRAIVTSIPGTTRDALSDAVAIRGIPVTLIDTAGIRETADLVERLGVERTHSAATEADIVIAVVDSTAESLEEDIRLAEESRADIVALNKCDLTPGPALTKGTHLFGGDVRRVSALTGMGIEELKDAIYTAITAGASPLAEGAIITSERHFSALTSALTSLEQVRQDLAAGLTEEIALANLHHALKNLGLVTGETLIADIINQIFATFCIGK